MIDQAAITQTDKNLKYIVRDLALDIGYKGMLDYMEKMKSGAEQEMVEYVSARFQKWEASPAIVGKPWLVSLVRKRLAKDGYTV